MRKSIKELSKIVAYDPVTGWITWAVDRPKARKGSRAGTVRPDGYRQVVINGTAYYEHILGFALHHGRWPKGEIDHKDKSRDNNRADNLREATKKQNGHNRDVRRDSRTGVKGVTWSKHKGKWLAYAFLGTFDNLDDARKAREEFEEYYHGEFRRRSEGNEYDK